MTKPLDNTAALAAITIKPLMLTWYGDILKGWYKQAGSKPTDAMLMVPALLGKRPGKEALHIAMCLRPEGCTVAQYVLAGSCGPANNYRRALVKAGWFSCTVEGKPYAFKLTVTAKGQAKLDKAQAALVAAEADAGTSPAKAKRKAKRKPANAVTVDQGSNEAPVQTPTSDAPTGVEAPASEAAPASVN
jgi:hypothetical protein